MTYRTLRTASILLAAIASTSWAASAPAPEQGELAERFLQIGQQFVTAKAGAPVAAALADAAERMFSDDPRLLREAIDLRLQLGQREAAIQLLSTYRKIDPNDQVAQIQSIDLITDGMQTADRKAEYLSRVSQSATVPAEIRSHAALLLAGVQSERGLDNEAQKAIDASLALNPLNTRALQAKLDRVTRQGNNADRAAALVNLLMAEPMQFAAYSQLAETLAGVGASAQAMDLYHQLFDVLNATNYLPTPDDSCNYAALLLAANKTRDAQAAVANALKIDPRPARAHYLQILAAWQLGDQTGAQLAFDDARNICLRNLMMLQASIVPSTPKFDESTKLTLPDVSAAVKQIELKKDARSGQAYLEALGDLGWLEAYFGGREPAPAVMSGIEALGGEGNVLGNRIAGFAALATGHADEAKVKLSAVAERDPLSQLGMLVLQLKAAADKATIVKAGSTLLEKLPIDVWSAMVRWSLHTAGPLTLHEADADAVIAAAAKLPHNWITFAQDGRSFYFATVDVVKANVQIGEPMIASVLVQNACDHPLVIGPGGAIEPKVALDAEVRGAISQTFPAVAVAQLTGKIVLQPRESTRTTIRLDDANLSGFSAGNPQVGLSIYASAVINPIVRNKAIAPGPGGFRAQAQDVINRSPVAYSEADTQKQLTTQLHSNDAVQRLRAVSTIGACAIFLNNGSDADRRLAPTAIAQLQTAADHDASATVRTVAWQQLAMLQDDAGRLKVIQKMLAAPDTETRSVGCVMAINRSAADRKMLLAPLTKDSDDIVQRLSQAIIALPEAPQQPATPLATQP